MSAVSSVAKPRRSRSFGLWWGGLIAGALLVVTPGSAILVLAMLSPTPLLALLPGRRGGMRAIQAPLLFGLAATVHPLHALWSEDSSLSGAIEMLRRPMVLPTSWIALMAGWLVSEVAATILRVHADLQAAACRRRMMESITTIEDEWGPMPASAPLPPL